MLKTSAFAGESREKQRAVEPLTSHSILHERFDDSSRLINLNEKIYIHKN